MKKQDIEKLKLLEKVIEKIFKDNFTYKYKKTSLHRSYIQVELNRQLNQKVKSLLISKINKEKFIYEVKTEGNNTIIEIYIHEIQLSLNK